MMEDSPDPATSLTLLNLLCSPRDEDAWRDFCRRYQPLIARWCGRWNLQAADVDDVSQRVLQRLFTSIGTYRAEVGRFRSWLKTVVENAVRDFHRSRGRRPGDHAAGGDGVDAILDTLAQPATFADVVDALDSGLRRDLDAALTRVAEDVGRDTMRAFRWTVLDGMPIADAAARLGKSYAAVCMAINRVKKKLRTEYFRLHPHDPRPDS